VLGFGLLDQRVEAPGPCILLNLRVPDLRLKLLEPP